MTSQTRLQLEASAFPCEPRRWHRPYWGAFSAGIPNCHIREYTLRKETIDSKIIATAVPAKDHSLSLAAKGAKARS